MPELPEVENLKRSLLPHLPGQRVFRVIVHRRDFVRFGDNPATARSQRIARPALLQDDTIASLHRHGKQLAIVGQSGRAICIHLGMSGQVKFVPTNTRLPKRDHIHITWQFEHGRMIFRDPRRFGGLWLFDSLDALRENRWSKLGPDGLSISPAGLRDSLSATSRQLKPTLLDQHVIAGLGNIYIDEILFVSRLHPARPANSLNTTELKRLTRNTRTILEHAIARGGSTLRDYVDANGRSGTFANHHRIYGRAGLPCVECGHRVETFQLAQRTTAICPNCQSLKS